ARRRRAGRRVRQRHPDRAGRGGGGQRPLRRAPDRRRQPRRADQEAAMSAVSLPRAVAGAAGSVAAAAAQAPGAGAGAPPPAREGVAGTAAAPAADAATPATVAGAFAARTQAQPVAGVAQPSAPGPVPQSPATAGSLGGAVFALVLVVGLILAPSWLARRMPGPGGSGRSPPATRIV